MRMCRTLLVFQKWLNVILWLNWNQVSLIFRESDIVWLLNVDVLCTKRWVIKCFFFQFIQKSNKIPNTTTKLEKLPPADEVPQSVVQSHFFTLFNASIIAKLISLTQLLSTDLENKEHCSIPVFAAKQLFCKSGHIVSTHILADRCSHNFTAYSQGGTMRSTILVRLPQFSHFWGFWSEIFSQKIDFSNLLFRLAL